MLQTCQDFSQMFLNAPVYLPRFYTFVPVRSLYYTPIDFWLWEYLKSEVYAFNPQIASDLKDAHGLQVQYIPHAMVRPSVL